MTFGIGAATLQWTAIDPAVIFEPVLLLAALAFVVLLAVNGYSGRSADDKPMIVNNPAR